LFPLGLGEILLIAALAGLLFFASYLPGLARTLGSNLASLRKSIKTGQDDSEKPNGPSA
jgi:Sec-independent protein translocase protein TatA